MLLAAVIISAATINWRSSVTWYNSRKIGFNKATIAEIC